MAGVARSGDSDHVPEAMALAISTSSRWCRSLVGEDERDQVAGALVAGILGDSS